MEEIVVGQHHVGGLLGHLGALIPIATPTSALEGGRVVDAVAGHGYDLPLACSALTSRSLCSGLVRAKVSDDSTIFCSSVLVARSSSGPLTAAGPPSPTMPISPRDRSRCTRMITGDHLHDDARLLAGGDRLDGIGTRRVDDAHKPQEHHA